MLVSPGLPPLLEDMEQGREETDLFRVRVHFGSFTRLVSPSAFLDPKHCLSRLLVSFYSFRLLRTPLTRNISLLDPGYLSSSQSPSLCSWNLTSDLSDSI